MSSVMSTTSATARGLLVSRARPRGEPGVEVAVALEKIRAAVGRHDWAAAYRGAASTSVDDPASPSELSDAMPKSATCITAKRTVITSSPP